MDSSEIGEFKNPNLLNDHFFNIPLTDIDIGRESIPILDLSTSFGRESLGILQRGADFNNVNVGEHRFSLGSLSDASTNVFDKAFMISTCKTSDLRSVSTVYSKCSSNFSVDLGNFAELSKVDSLGTFTSGQSRDGINILNDAFLNETQKSSQFSIFRSRFLSAPIYPKISEEFDSKALIQQLMNRVSEGCQKLNDSILRKPEEEDKEEGVYNDSVFIEARHLTAKFSEEGSNDGFLLDETDPPEFLNGDFEESKCDQKCDSKDIFKKIDTFLPVTGYQKLNEKLDNMIVNQISPQIKPESDNKEETNTQEKKTGITDIEKSKEILNALSEILLKDDRSEKDTERGQDLLHTLGDILNKKSDRRSKSFTLSSERDNSQQSNQSVSKHIDPIPRKTSNSFSNALNNSKSKLMTSLGRSQNSVSSEMSLEGRNFSADNLKPKKTGPAPSRRGPMKATIPMENFTRSHIKGTPPRIQQKLPRLSGRISTPIREAHPKPMAQSTPDNRMNGINVSSNLKEKSNNTSSINSLSSYKDSSVSREGSFTQNSRLPRRNSVSEVRRSPLASEFKRSNSMKETTLMKTMNKIRQNISNSMDLPKKEALRDRSNTSAREVSSYSGKNDSSGSKKIIDTPKKMIQTSGKENSLIVY